MSMEKELNVYFCINFLKSKYRRGLQKLMQNAFYEKDIYGFQFFFHRTFQVYTYYILKI